MDGALSYALCRNGAEKCLFFFPFTCISSTSWGKRKRSLICVRSRVLRRSGSSVKTNSLLVRPFELILFILKCTGLFHHTSLLHKNKRDRRNCFSKGSHRVRLQRRHPLLTTMTSLNHHLAPDRWFLFRKWHLTTNRRAQQHC